MIFDRPIKKRYISTPMEQIVRYKKQSGQKGYSGIFSLISSGTVYISSLLKVRSCFNVRIAPIISNTNKIQEKICAEITYKPVKNSYGIIGLNFSEF